MSKALTPRQERFAQEYPQDWNATKAAIRAGYSERAAHVTGNRLLRNDAVRAVISSITSEASQQARVSAVWVRACLRDIVERSMQAAPVLDAQGEPSGVYRYDGAVANRALELLGRDQGMFGGRLEVSLGGASRELVECLSRLAVECCAPDKRQQLAAGVEALRVRFSPIVADGGKG
jgi:phage terminase small subunit